MNSPIIVKNIHKRFGKQKVLDGIDVTFNPGSINAIMGPNGSGKSTFIKSILGLVIPDAGEIVIEGENVIGKSHYRKHIGYMPQIATYPENITVMELIRMIMDVRKEEAEAATYLEVFNLKGALNKRLKDLSGGMRQKVNAIIAFMFSSSILIFDEPTVGLDPLSRISFKEMVRSAKEKGKTIILSTHYLNEIEELADQIVFILDGKVFFKGTVEEMKLQQDQRDLEHAAAKILEKKSVIL